MVDARPIARSLLAEAEARTSRAERALEAVLTYLDRVEQTGAMTSAAWVEMSVQRIIREAYRA